MNNQVWAKDIKPFEWEELDGKTLQIRAGKHEGAMIVVGYDQETKDTFVLHEEFSAIPTIKPGDKKFKCFGCKEISSAQEWNLATMNECGGHDIVPIESTSAADAHFYCPKCGEESDYHYLEVVE